MSPRGTLGYARTMSPQGRRRAPRRIGGTGRRERAPLLRRTATVAVSRPSVADESKGWEIRNFLLNSLFTDVIPSIGFV